jgi:aspartyl aminopeptidase
MMKDTGNAQKVAEKRLVAHRKHAWNDIKKIFSFSEDYKGFLADSKTERTATKTILGMLKEAGYKDIEKLKTLAAGDRIYLNYKDKSVICGIIGNTNDRINLIGSHIDSPRLDLKPNPVFEANGMALLKTHYYGGIKKYQWTNVELAMHGVIFTKDGKKVEISIGEKDEEPRFIVSDLLPHLAKKQLEKTGNEIVEAEQLNVFIGNIPVEGDDIKEKVKLYILKLLNDKYGIIEEDFSFAELHFVPAGPPRDIGFDKSMISAYGHDDKACAFASLRALLDIKKPSITAIAYFSDKEEIGSMGNTGAYSFILLDFAELLVSKLGLGITAKSMLRNSRAISADVSTAIDPNFPDVFEERNTAKLGFGTVIEKYTGSGGKYSANDASAEYMKEIRELIDKNKINYQSAELGKIDIGGGGTIALYLSRFGMDTVDIGPGVLGMHSPREVISKADLYESYRLYKAFLG